MEVYLYNSTVCRLCGEENDNGTFLYSCEENNQNLSEVINTYLPIRVYDDGELPRTICPGCTIQLEATVEFLTLIVNGQKIIRELHQREKEYKKTIFTAPEQEVITENIVYEVNKSDGVYQVEHPIALQVAGLDKPKRKRGRPPKKTKTPEELAQEVAAKEKETKAQTRPDFEQPSGKRRRKTPTRYKEAVQGKELDRIFKDEGVTDGEESDYGAKRGIKSHMPAPREPEIIGHMENSGELVVFAKGKGRGRPKGPMRPTRRECAICGMAFSCAGRYMAHVAQHGPVIYKCEQCGDAFDTHLAFTQHQKEKEHSGKSVTPIGKKAHMLRKQAESDKQAALAENQQELTETPDVGVNMLIDNMMTSLPDLSAQPITSENAINVLHESESPVVEVASSPLDGAVKINDTTSEVETTEKRGDAQLVEVTAAGKVKLKCNHCDKMFSNKQSKSLHIKATHQGERPYACPDCGARFAYPRSLALHAVTHRRHRAAGQAKGFACDLCGKVLNHPSSVVYHKEAEHAGQRYVCSKCGKSFKHKQLLQRHQLVHTQARPFTCKTCNSSFKTKANMLNHQLLHSGVKKFSCEICKHKFAHKTSLTLHMRWHTGQKPYSCNICGKSFTQKGNLSEHTRIHTGEKPFLCAACPRRFTTSSQRRLHARRHAAERAFACAHCGKRFASRGAWAAHARREGSARPLRCAACPRAFAERWALRKHQRLHSGERPFRCPLCPRAFADCSNLNKHKKQVHKQMSLLASSQPQPPTPTQVVVLPQGSSVVKAAPEESQDSIEERVIYVTYDVDEPDSPAFHILSPEQAAGLEENKVLAPPELYHGSSILVPQEELDALEMEPETLELVPEQIEQDIEELVLDEQDHNMPVTDEQGNPLHFTMQDGTQLAITSVDGRSLQVITKDGQTIPVEINGYAEEEEIENTDTIVHQLNLQKSGDNEVPSPVTYYTLV